jgi:hypothetical protein
MIEGVVCINRLEPPEADRVRTLLWRTMLQFTVEISGNSRRNIRSEQPSSRVA